MEDLSDRVLWILEQKGWSGRQLAREAGLSETHVGILLQGQGAKVPTLIAIAKAAGYDFTWLATGTGTPQGQPARTVDRELPIGLREVLEHDAPRGRKGAWLPLTIDQLAQSFSYGGVDRTPEEWSRLGDDYDYVNRRAGFTPKAPSRVERLADVIDDEVSKRRAAARARRKA